MLTNNIFEEKTFKQFRETSIRAKFLPSYATFFMADVKEKILNSSEEKPALCWRYIDIFFIWEYGEESSESFLNKLNTFHLTVKFTADYSQETILF